MIRAVLLQTRLLLLKRVLHVSLLFEMNIFTTIKTHPTYVLDSGYKLDDNAKLLPEWECMLTFCGIDIDTSVLGIGERNGICPLGALVSYTLTLKESICGLI